MARAQTPPSDDATDLTVKAWRLLESESGRLGLPGLQIQPAADFMNAAEQHRTSHDERMAILDQAKILFSLPAPSV